MRDGLLCVMGMFVLGNCVSICKNVYVKNGCVVVGWDFLGVLGRTRLIVINIHAGNIWVERSKDMY